MFSEVGSATRTLIVGGGLAGLALARRLHERNEDFLLLEARDRLGGRIHSLAPRGGSDPATHHDTRYDMGPAWFWPGQPLMAQLAGELELDVFEQYASGRLVMQDGQGNVSRDHAFSTMAGSLRIAGGLTALVDRMAARLPIDRLHLGHQISRLYFTLNGIRVCGTAAGNPFDITARNVALALPPRLAMAGIDFEPALEPVQARALANIPTWMAAHAKVVAVYRTPFWRALGLSGDGMSRRGPLAEIHDASPADASQGALFGFVGVPAAQRAGREADLLRASLDQLVAMFGPQAADVIDLIAKDWTQDPLTATVDDSAGPAAHPAYGLPISCAHLWQGRLAFCSTETATGNGGLLEGALEAAERMAATLAAPDLVRA